MVYEEKRKKKENQDSLYGFYDKKFDERNSF